MVKKGPPNPLIPKAQHVLAKVYLPRIESCRRCRWHLTTNDVNLFGLKNHGTRGNGDTVNVDRAGLVVRHALYQERVYCGYST